MTNGLIAAVFTSGLLKIIKVGDFVVVREIDLLEDLEDFSRVIDAKLCSHTCRSVVSQRSINKTIRLCVGYACQGGKEHNKFWRVCAFDLTFENVLFSIAETDESNCDLS